MLLLDGGHHRSPHLIDTDVIHTLAGSQLPPVVVLLHHDCDCMNESDHESGYGQVNVMVMEGEEGEMEIGSHKWEGC